MIRWTAFLGRGSTVLIAIGLALLLVSLLPSTGQRIFAPSTDVPPKKVSLLSNQRLYSSIDQDLQSYEILQTPQEGLQIKLWVNGTLDVYILEVNSEVLYQWVGNEFLNVTDLEEFLEANPNVIGWYDEVRNGYDPYVPNIEYEYVPTEVTNATLVFSNPNSEDVHVDVYINLMSHIVHGNARNLGLWAIPIGFVLFLPWLTARARK